MPSLVVLDGNALIHRAYHAVPKSIRLENGQVVNALYGFISLVLGILQEEKPLYLAVALDESGPTFRHHDYAAYKETRARTDDDLISQFPLIYNILEAFGVPLYREPGLEADDFLGLISHSVAKSNPELPILLVTGDQDALQLVTEQVTVVSPISGYTKVKRYDDAAVFEKLGVYPKQVPDYKGLSGDSSDNLPGVAGIGPKRASDLLKSYGHLEGIYERLNELPERLRITLELHRDLAFLCRQVATILSEKEGFSFDLDAARTSRFHFNRLQTKFSDYRFHSLIPKLKKVSENHIVQNTLF